MILKIWCVSVIHVSHLKDAPLKLCAAVEKVIDYALSAPENGREAITCELGALLLQREVHLDITHD